MLVGGTEQMVSQEGTLGRALDVVRVYATWSQTSLPSLNMTQLKKLADGGRRSIFISAVIPWTSWQGKMAGPVPSTAYAKSIDAPNCKWRPTDPNTGQVRAGSWFKAFADGAYDVRLRNWLAQVDSLGSPSNPVFLSLMPEADRLDASPESAQYKQCVGTPEEFRAGWARAYQVAAGQFGGSSLNLSDGTGGHLVWVPVFTDYAFVTTEGYSGEARSLVEFKTGLPPPNSPPDQKTLKIARATPWMPPPGTWDHVGIDVFNFSGAVAGSERPTRIKVDDPATQKKETDQWRSVDVLTRPVLLWSTYNAPRPDGADPTVILAELGSVPDPTRPDRRPDWIAEGCSFLQSAHRIVGALYFHTKTVRLSNWNWTKRSDGAWDAVGSPLGTDTASMKAWGAVMASPRAGGSVPCGEEEPPPPPPDDIQWVQNQGVEQTAVPWLDTYGANPRVTRTAGGHASNWAMTVEATSGTATGAGLSDKPRNVTSTIAGTTYTASAWVRAGAVGQRIAIQLREWKGSTLVATQRVDWTATSTDWHQISVPLTAATAGSSLSFAVFSPYIAAPQTFQVDDFSLTSPPS
jgi:hypothetical protein